MTPLRRLASLLPSLLVGCAPCLLVGCAAPGRAVPGPSPGSRPDAARPDAARPDPGAPPPSAGTPLRLAVRLAGEHLELLERAIAPAQDTLLQLREVAGDLERAPAPPPGPRARRRAESVAAARQETDLCAARVRRVTARLERVLRLARAARALVAALPEGVPDADRGRLVASVTRLAERYFLLHRAIADLARTGAAANEAWLQARRTLAAAPPTLDDAPSLEVLAALVRVEDRLLESAPWAEAVGRRVRDLEVDVRCVEEDLVVLAEPLARRAHTLPAEDEQGALTRQAALEVEEWLAAQRG
ncbi:MAG: hypothetical protein AB7N76_36010 [Planctomycetota bacterium]